MTYTCALSTSDWMWRSTDEMVLLVSYRGGSRQNPHNKQNQLGNEKGHSVGMQELALSTTGFNAKSNGFNQMIWQQDCSNRVAGCLTLGSRLSSEELNPSAPTLNRLEKMMKITLATVLRFGLVVCLAILVSVPALATVVIVGLPADSATGNQYPFGGLYNGEYQQVYTSSLFSGPITITNLEFFNTQFDSGSTLLGSATTTISLSTT